jgi:hypothetical protein
LNISHRVASPKSRIFLPVLVVAGLIAFVFAITSASAPASLGGINLGGETQSNGAGKISKINAKYERLWRKVNRHNRRWARSTARCESGRNAKAIGYGGLYRGAFQFLKSTWKTSPKSPGGDPIKYAYKTQAVVAVALKQRDGRYHWPVCG